MDGWKMTGHRFRIDSSEFRRKLSRKHLKVDFAWFLDFLTSHYNTKWFPSCLQIDPRWSLDAPWVLLDPLEIIQKTIENQKHEKLKPGDLEICEDAHRQIVDISLVEILSTWMPCHLVTKRNGFPQIHPLIIQYPQHHFVNNWGSPKIIFRAI